MEVLLLGLVFILMLNLFVVLVQICKHQQLQICLYFQLDISNNLTMQWMKWRGSTNVNANVATTFTLNYPITTNQTVPISIIQSYYSGMRFTINGDASIPYTSIQFTGKNWNSSNSVTVNLIDCFCIDF